MKGWIQLQYLRSQRLPNSQLTWHCSFMTVDVTPPGQGVMKVISMREAVRLVVFQVTLAPVWVGGVFAIPSRAGRRQRLSILSDFQEDRVRLASC